MPAARNRNILTVAFAAFTLVLAVMAGMSTSNYYQYYPAIGKIEVNLLTLHWDYLNTTFGGPTLKTNVSFTVQNPTDYNGFELAQLSLPKYDINSESQNITEAGSGPTAFIIARLDPRNPVTVKLPLFNTTSNVAMLANQPQFTFVFTVSFRVSSFMDQRAHPVLEYVCRSHGEPAECILSNLNVVTASGISGGGGR